MTQKLKAIYRKNTFILQERCDLPEDAVVDLIIQSSPLLPAEVTDHSEKAIALERVIERMRSNPIPPGSPRLTREDMHERR